MGRRKIEIQPLTDDRNRTVTFVKRKAGLFKKAHELSVLCQVDLAVIIVGSNNKIYEFSSVDTNELINFYKTSPKPHESKSPANYGNYKKKKHLNEGPVALIDEEYDEIDNSDDNSDYDSDTPEPKRQKRSHKDMTRTKRPAAAPSHISLGNIPTFNSFRSNVIKEEEEDDGMPRQYRNESINSTSTNLSRPVLRVQIPTDSKNSTNDSARTITALETNTNTALRLRTNDESDNSKSSPKDSKGDSTSQSQTTAGGPNINSSKYTNFSTFRSPATTRPITQLPIPISSSKSQTSSPNSATAPPLPANGMTPFYNILPQPSPSSQFPNSSLQTPTYYQMMFNDPKFRNFQQNNTPGNQNGANEPPMSGLPSRYINDMFPSPSTFYVPQEWPNTGTGMTPLHGNAPQYFGNMMPNQRQPQQQKNPQLQQQQQNQQPNGASAMLQNSSSPMNQPANPQNPNYLMPSPLQFIGNSSYTGDKK